MTKLEREMYRILKGLETLVDLFGRPGYGQIKACGEQIIPMRTALAAYELKRSREIAKQRKQRERNKKFYRKYGTVSGLPRSDNE